MTPTPLPIDDLLPAIRDALQASPNLVLQAAPGAGKTTRVPRLMLDLVPGQVLVLEPRRIAARLAARRVAAELGEAVGGTVGYQVRFEDVSGPKTRLRFLTEGVFTRRLLSNPSLHGVDVVILDEFHERHIESDLALSLLRRLQCTRPTLRIVVMSATLDAVPIAAFLGDCPILESRGRVFPLTIEHAPYSADPLELQVRAAAERISSISSGHILTFLPGQGEIHRALRACEEFASRRGWRVLPLHGSLSPEEQDRAIAPSVERKLILATNVAESSVTLDGVTAVIDSGLARFASFAAWTGLPSLQVGRISKASARQRAGRAGRTAPGHVLRLYSELDFAQRKEQDLPEILTSDLTQLLLTLQTMGVAEPGALDWLDAPPEPAWRHAADLLGRLGAVGDRATQMARFPLQPRLSRLLLEAAERGVPDDGCDVAALLSNGLSVRENDLLNVLEHPLDARARQTQAQLRRLLHAGPQTAKNDEALLLAVLSAFPDRVARKRAGKHIMLSNSVAAQVEGEEPPYAFLAALDAEDRSERQLPLVRLFSRVEPEWLIDLFPERVREVKELEWNAAAQRVEAFSRLRYDDMIIDESRDASPAVDAVADLLATKALEAGIARFIEADAAAAFLARVNFAGLPPPDLERELAALCVGLNSFAQLKEQAKHLLTAIEQALDAKGLRERAPATLRLAAGRQVRIQYEEGKPPSIASRLQDFFGMQETPLIGAARTAVVLHLLAPNQRAVQVTSDLAGFWQNHYPKIRKELMRRYPRHAWPERP